MRERLLRRPAEARDQRTERNRAQQEDGRQAEDGQQVATPTGDLPPPLLPCISTQSGWQVQWA